MAGIFNSSIFNNAVFNTGAAPAPPTVLARPVAVTIGGIGQWTIQFPHVPKKKLPVFVRNVENQDRSDVDDIVKLLSELQ